MCVLFANDDIADDLEFDCMVDAMRVAERGLIEIVARVRDGATRNDFPRQNADAAIHKAVGDVEAARRSLDRLMASRLIGRLYTMPPSPSAVRLELQRQVTRNEEAAGIRPVSWLRPAFEAVDAAAADARLTRAAQARGSDITASLPAYAAHDAGFHSPAAG